MSDLLELSPAQLRDLIQKVSTDDPQNVPAEMQQLRTTALINGPIAAFNCVRPDPKLSQVSELEAALPKLLTSGLFEGWGTYLTPFFPSLIGSRRFPLLGAPVEDPRTVVKATGERKRELAALVDFRNKHLHYWSCGTSLVSLAAALQIGVLRQDKIPYHLAAVGRLMFTVRTVRALLMLGTTLGTYGWASEYMGRWRGWRHNSHTNWQPENRLFGWACTSAVTYLWLRNVRRTILWMYPLLVGTCVFDYAQASLGARGWTPGGFSMSQKAMEAEFIAHPEYPEGPTLVPAFRPGFQQWQQPTMNNVRMPVKNYMYDGVDQPESEWVNRGRHYVHPYLTGTPIDPMMITYLREHRNRPMNELPARVGLRTDHLQRLTPDKLAELESPYQFFDWLMEPKPFNNPLSEGWDVLLEYVFKS